MGSNVNVNLGQIHGLIQAVEDNRNPTYEYGQVPYFYHGNDPGWVPRATPAEMLHDSDFSRYDDAQSEDMATPTVTSETYTTWSAAPSTVFSDGARSYATQVTAPDDIPRPPVSVVGLHPFYLQQLGPGRHDQILWCEFSELKNCHATFRLDEEDEWIEHHTNHHLGGNFPRKLMCWFCDHVPFVAGRREEAFANFTERMQHIRRHIFDDLRCTIESMRPDLHVVKHLFKIGLLSERRYREAMSYNELPPACRLPGGHSQSSSSSQRPLSQRVTGQVHDLDKEERRRRKEKQASGGGRR